VQKIIQAYDRFENERRTEHEKRSDGLAARKFKKN
jgi:hypothetical protein